MHDITSSSEPAALAEHVAVTILPTRATVRPSERVEAALVVRNRSQKIETYRLRVEGDLAPWARLAPQQLTLELGEETATRLVLDVPVLARAATHNLSIYADGARVEPLARLTVEVCEDRLLSYLPGLFHDDALLRGFLRIFEAILGPLDRQIEQLYAYFDPRLTPTDFLPWLATWFDFVLDENWPPERRRLLLQHAAELYEMRGTAHALHRYLTIYAGVPPVITEADGDGDPFHFTVTFFLEQPNTIDEERVRRIIEEEKPAHTSFTLRLEQR